MQGAVNQSMAPCVTQFDHVSEVTENSARLHWERPEPPSPYVYNLTVTSAHDQAVVLKQNLTVTARVVGGTQCENPHPEGVRNPEGQGSCAGADDDIQPVPPPWRPQAHSRAQLVLS